MSKFDPEFYSRFRPFYPAEMFAGLAAALESGGFAPPFEIADVGCGTGHSTASLLASGIKARVTGVDPDPGMLAKAAEICPRAFYVQGTGEQTGLQSGAFDAVTIGSAFHWMDALRARSEILRLLKRGGLFLVYEYQFPKARARPELNEWVRREFNLRWKAPGQRPRGAFDEVTRCFRTDSRFALVGVSKVPMIQCLDAQALTGLILSQSRVLHYEDTMTLGERDAFREEVGRQVARLLGSPGTDEFDFSLQAALFRINQEG